MEKKITEISLKAQESEYMVPEGYIAEIVDGKVVVKKKESNGERIRKNCIHFLELQKEYHVDTSEIDDCITYLEMQKEPAPIPDKFSGLKSLLLQYLQSATNRKDDVEIEDDTDLWGRKILDYVWKQDGKQTLENYKISDERSTAKMEGRIEGRQDVINNPEEYGLQKPVEWSEEDLNMIGSIMSTIELDIQRNKKYPGIKKVHEKELKWFNGLYQRNIPVKKQELNEDDMDLTNKIVTEWKRIGLLTSQKEQKSVECIEFDNEFNNQVSHLIASVLNGEHEYNEGFIKYATQSLLGYAKNELKHAGWSEEDRRIANRIQMILEFYDRNYPTDANIGSEIPKYISWLRNNLVFV